MCPLNYRSSQTTWSKHRHFIEKKTGALERSGFAEVPERERIRTRGAAPGSGTTAVSLSQIMQQKRMAEEASMSPGLAARTPRTCSDFLTFVKLMFNKCTNLHSFHKHELHALPISHGELCGEVMNPHDHPINTSQEPALQLEDISWTHRTAKPVFKSCLSP